MTIYILTFALSISLFLVFNRFNIATSRSASSRMHCLPVLVAAVPPALLAALRYNVGTDYFGTYYSGFYRILAGSNFDQFEIGYWTLSKLVQLFSDNVFILFAITSIIFVGFSYAAIASLSDNVPLSILLFLLMRYYFMGLNAVRQFMALAVFAYAMRYVVKRDFRRYLLLSCIAASFHISSVLLIPIYWLVNFEARPRYVVLGSILLLVGGGVIRGVASIVLDDGSKYGVILSSYGVAGSLFTVGTIGINVFILLICYSGYSKRKDDVKYRTFLWLQVLATLVTMLLPVIPVIERIYWYFSFFSIVSLPYMLKGIRSQSVRVGTTIVLLAGLGFYMYYDIVILEDHEVIPYESIIGHEALPYTGFDYRSVHRLG